MNSRTSAESAVPAESLEDGVADFVHKIRMNPRPYVMKVVVLGVVALAAVVGVRVWKKSSEGKATGIAQELQKAVSATEPAERIAILGELKAKTTGTQTEAPRLFRLAEAYRELAEKAATGPEKIEAWTNCLASLTALEQFPQSPWMRMTVKPGPEGSSPTLAAALKTVAEQQLAWLKANPYAAAVDADPGLSVVFELDNGATFTVGKLYSRVSPYHVQNFVDLCRAGYYDGTAIGTLKKWYRKAAAASTEQTVVGVEVGDAMTKVTPEDRTDDDVDPAAGVNDLSYTLPDEPNPLTLKRGSLVGRVDFAAGGESPTRFTIYVEDTLYPQGAPFAEITDGFATLENLMKAETEAEKTERLKSPVRIKKVTVTGSVAFPPTGRKLPAYTPEMLPKPKAK